MKKKPTLFLMIIFLFVACGNQITSPSVPNNIAPANPANTDSSAPASDTATETTQNNFETEEPITFKPYSPCANEACSAHVEKVPPEELWCATGYISCPVNK